MHELKCCGVGTPQHEPFAAAANEYSGDCVGADGRLKQLGLAVVIAEFLAYANGNHKAEVPT